MIVHHLHHNLPFGLITIAIAALKVKLRQTPLVMDYSNKIVIMQILWDN